MAEWRGRFLSKLITTAAKRRETLGILISTPGGDKDGVWNEEVDRARRVLAGELQLEDLQAFLYEVDEDDDIDDPDTWPKANPGSIDAVPQPAIADLLSLHKRLRITPMGTQEFARFICCRPMLGKGTWLPMECWQDQDPIDPETLRGRPAWLGVDVSKTLDLSAIVAAVPLDDGRVALLVKAYWPEESHMNREVEYGLPLRDWSARGHLTLTPGREIDLDRIRADVAWFRSLLEVRTVAYDKYGSVYLRKKMAEEDGVPLLEAPMGITWIGPASQLFLNLWVAKRIAHGGNPVLRRCAADADAWTDTNGNVRPVKRGKRVIDALVASIIALYTWELETATAASGYEDTARLVV